MPHSRTTLVPAVLCALLAVSQAAEKKTVAQSDNLGNVIHVAGLAEIKGNVKGILTLTPNALVFTSESINASIPISQILNVSVGDQRTEPWGIAGIIARRTIPYGGGMALAALTSRRVDLLTIEYLDSSDGYHGVVFVVPSQKASAMHSQLLARLTPQAPHSASVCSGTEVLPQRSVLVTPIALSGIDLPAEYRVLLYEQLLKQLKAKRPNDIFVRTGDLAEGPSRTIWVLQVTVKGFKKGNRTVRTTTGPLGLFLGTTSLSVDVRLRDSRNSNVFETQIKKSKRIDSDSLEIANVVAKSIAKRLSQVLQKAGDQCVPSSSNLPCDQGAATTSSRLHCESG